MNRKRFVAGVGVLALGTAAIAAVIGVARAQPAPGALTFPDPSEVGFSAANDVKGWINNGPPLSGSSFTLVTSEPDKGFVGACLGDYVTYAPTLPLACYAPPLTVNYGSPSTTAMAGSGNGTPAPKGPSNGPAAIKAGFMKVTFPAAKVARRSSTLPPGYDSYQVLRTCYPHNPDGTCPQMSSPISRSCCDNGAYMTSLDGNAAQGYVFFHQ